MGHLFVAFGVDIVEDGVEFREVALDVGDFEVVESDFLFFEEDAEFWVLKDELGDGSHGVEFFDESQGCDGGGKAGKTYDLLISLAAMESPQVRAFLRILGSEAFLRRLDALGGYTYDQPGRIKKIWPEKEQE